ncbi:MAG: DUF1318 domain-containing protein [Candidatus Omnitrophota bacterium]
MKRLLFVLAAVILAIGCARVSVQGSKEPIKLDISMRLDIYQHVEKDIDAIEGIVSGDKDNKKPVDKQSFLSSFINNAYAEEEEFNPEVREAALRRKARVDELRAFEEKGIIGENKMGLVEVRDQSQATDSVRKLVEAENSDRMFIFKSMAAKNNISVQEVQKLYAKRLYHRLRPGTPVEVLNEASGNYEWSKK